MYGHYRRIPQAEFMTFELSKWCRTSSLQIHGYAVATLETSEHKGGQNSLHFIPWHDFWQFLQLMLTNSPEAYSKSFICFILYKI